MSIFHVNIKSTIITSHFFLRVEDNSRYAQYFDRYKVVWHRTLKRSLVANGVNLIGFRFLGASLFLVPFKDYKSMMAAIDAERSIMNDFFDGLRPWISSDGAIDRFARISISEPLNQEKDAAVSDLVVVDAYNKADVDTHLERNTVDLDIFKLFYNFLSIIY
ncbi:hypothetical protein NC653_016757 [Populus alba x Populus x berolinensis]|uniref:Uncharacterized protein n=1 Tax=Populus alba x Populus x berolinensis TaxID=444605 RepID=A0AAD6QNM0_9ROSI|nr:hypothetical protein NC653_016757 [Populus alba x Populus x berolinensis]